MSSFNISPQNNIASAYLSGLLPQRNNRDLFYQDSSCRSNLHELNLSSENRRILRKTDNFKYVLTTQNNFKYNPKIQKQIHEWLKVLAWDFPTSSVKTVFTNHIFNQFYTWTDTENNPVAYSVCYFDSPISQIAYVFYDPKYSHSDLPIRLVLQFVIDSHEKGFEFAYLGRFSETTGYYKRNMPGFEYFSEGQWLTYSK